MARIGIGLESAAVCSLRHRSFIRPLKGWSAVTSVASHLGFCFAGGDSAHARDRRLNEIALSLHRIHNVGPGALTPGPLGRSGGVRSPDRSGRDGAENSRSRRFSRICCNPSRPILTNRPGLEPFFEEELHIQPRPALRRVHNADIDPFLDQSLHPDPLRSRSPRAGKRRAPSPASAAAIAAEGSPTVGCGRPRQARLGNPSEYRHPASPARRFERATTHASETAFQPASARCRPCFARTVCMPVAPPGANASTDGRLCDVQPIGRRDEIACGDHSQECASQFRFNFNSSRGVVSAEFILGISM